MIYNCFQEPQELFFLQKRQGLMSPANRCRVISPTSRHHQKKSLRTLKSVRSQKSLKTIDSETPRQYTPITSLKFLENEEKTKLKRVTRVQEFAAAQNPVNMEKKQKIDVVGGRMRMEKKITYPGDRPTQRVSIRFEDPVILKRFLSPQPSQITERVILNQSVLTPEVPSLNLTILERESSLDELKQETFSITIFESPERTGSKEEEKEEEQDLKSTHHLDNLRIPLPEKAKSTVSMISDRSETDSVVMDHLPFSGKLTKLV